ncbi:Emopamil-binding protein, partial [Mycotypha africana]|uniref:Emopamil-binding protein n=1 Tax=Mycotypha africana TaxID=64632 RepID=UPI002301576A
MTTHPYYPVDLIIPNYIPTQRTTLEILVAVGVIFTLLLSLCYYSVTSETTSVKRFTWFTICGLLHLGFEGYWLYNKDSIAIKTDLLGEMWKEYARGDSRYMVADELLFIWGPLCCISAYYIWRGSPKQYIFQMVASLCHLFSCSLYYIMDLPNAPNCDPQALTFWIYFVAFNAPWIIVRYLLSL